MEETSFFSITEIEDAMLAKSLFEIYEALMEKGYNPINQITGYLITNDLTYITSYKNSRNKIAKLDKDKIIKLLLERYFEK